MEDFWTPRMRTAYSKARSPPGPQIQEHFRRVVTRDGPLGILGRHEPGIAELSRTQALQHAAGDELLDGGHERAPLALDAEVVGDARLAGDAAGTHGALDLHAARRLERGLGRSEHFRREDALGQGIATLHPVAPRDRQVPGRPEGVEHALGRRPLPVALARAAEVA